MYAVPSIGKQPPYEHAQGISCAMLQFPSENRCPSKWMRNDPWSNEDYPKVISAVMHNSPHPINKDNADVDELNHSVGKANSGEVRKETSKSPCICCGHVEKKEL